MRSTSVDEAKLLAVEKYGAEPTEEISAYANVTGKAPISGIALGKCRHARGFGMAIFVTDQASLATGRLIAEDVRGEARVHVMTRPRPRITKSWSQRHADPMFIGQQIRPYRAPWVGTGSIFVPTQEDPEVIGQVTNNHVVGIGAERGLRMDQGRGQYGMVWGTSNVSFRVPQEHDSALNVVTDSSRWFMPRWDHGLDDEIRGIRSARTGDLGKGFCNTGQTLGTLFGECVAIDIDGLGVGYDRGVGHFDNQLAFAKRGGGVFSIGGHSGSTICRLDDGFAVGLLFAGGLDSRGEDITFANDLPGAIVAAGGRPELA